MRIESPLAVRLFCVVLLVLAIMPADGKTKNENSTALYVKAAAMARAGRIDDAIGEFQRLIDISPYYALAHYGIGKAYLFKEGKTEEAIRHLRLATILDRKFARAYFYLGFGLMFNKNRRYAIHAFDRAYQLDNGYIESLYNIGAIYDSMNARDKARRYYNLYLQKKEKGRKRVLF